MTMRRARKPRQAPKKRPRRRSVPTAAPRQSAAETALLALARTLATARTADPSPREAVTRTLATLAASFQAGAPLPRALAQARLAALGDKTRALALAWAREQLRLLLGEVLEGAAAAGAVRVGLTPDSIAWILLAACEALADEPPQAAPDRIRALEDWLTGGYLDD